MKVVINRCFGGFGLSQEALRELQELDDKLVTTHWEVEYGHSDEVPPMEALWLVEDEGCHTFRANLNLVEVVEKLGTLANGGHSDLKIVEIPDDVDYEICEHDGDEWVAEAHRTWA
jgi:hypothetical protein